MKTKIIFAGLLALALAGCNRDPAGKDGLTSAQRQQVDNAAAMVDDQTIDTSPDSLTLNEGAAEEMAGNIATTTPANGATPVQGNTTTNAQRPR